MSLLLDALKKAALEKQRREQPQGAAPAASPRAAAAPVIPAHADLPEPQPEPAPAREALSLAVEPMSEILEAGTDDKPSSGLDVADDDQAHFLTRAAPIDLGALHPNLAADDELSMAAATTSAPAVGAVDATELSFDINDIEPHFLAPVETELERLEVAPELVETVLEPVDAKHQIAAQSATQTPDHEVDGPAALKPSHPQAPAKPHSKPSEAPPVMRALRDEDEAENARSRSPAKAMAPAAATAPAPAAETAAASGATDKTPVARFDAVSGKAALVQMMERSKKASSKTRKRVVFMYTALVVTGVVALALYYFVLFMDSSAINAATMQRVAAEVSAPPIENPRAKMPADVVPKVVADDPANAESATVAAVASPSANAPADTSSPADTSPPVDTARSVATAPPSDASPPAAAAAPKATVTTPTATKEASPAKTPSTALIEAPAAKAAAKPRVVEAKENVDDKPVRSVTVTPSPSLDSLISAGYNAYLQGDLTAADQAYRSALAQDQYNRDALLGAAAVATRLGHLQDALNLYQKQLARAPKDEYAQAGILAISARGERNPELESELNRLLREYPNAAHLHLLKGTLLADQQQWAGAQAAYFEAYERDSKNPDVAYNLAIALDHLDQPKEATRYYQMALSLATEQPNFSVEAVQARVRELTGATP